MAQPVTEIVYINLQAGVDFTSPGQDAQIWQETLTTLASQDGFLAQRYGRQLEKPEVLMLLIGTLPFVRDLPSHAAFLQIGQAWTSITSSSTVPNTSPLVKSWGRSWMAWRFII